MLPDDGQLSDLSVPAVFVDGRPARTSPVHNTEMGGIALNDPSQGLTYQLWSVRYEDDNVLLRAPEVEEMVLFTRPNITMLGLAFDQNMHPCIAFIQGPLTWIWWFDVNVGEQVFTQLPDGITSIVCCLDDRRPEHLSNSDIIVAYVREGSLYYRQQRDRYTIEYLLMEDCPLPIIDIGMNTGLRLQFVLGEYSNPLIANPDFSSVSYGKAVDVPVLANDTYFGEPVELSDLADLPKITRKPIVGSVSVNPDGTVNFVAPRGFMGQITFEYEIRTPPEND